MSAKPIQRDHASSEGYCDPNTAKSDMRCRTSSTDKNFIALFLSFCFVFVVLTRHLWMSNPRLALSRESKEDKVKKIEEENDKRLNVANDWMSENFLDDGSGKSGNAT